LSLSVGYSSTCRWVDFRAVRRWCRNWLTNGGRRGWATIVCHWRSGDNTVQQLSWSIVRWSLFVAWWQYRATTIGILICFLCAGSSTIGVVFLRVFVLFYYVFTVEGYDKDWLKFCNCTGIYTICMGNPGAGWLSLSCDERMSHFCYSAS